MKITAIKLAQKTLSPTELLREFQRGKRPRYQHGKDALIEELSRRCEKYKKTESLEDKRKIIQLEKDILTDGLAHPEMTLARNYRKIVTLLKAYKTDEPISNLLYLFNMTALGRLTAMGSAYKYFNCDVSRADINLLKKVFDKVNPDTQTGKEALFHLVDTLDIIKIINPKLENRVDKVLLQLQKKIKDPELISQIQQELTIIDVQKLIKSLRKDFNQPSKLKNLFNSASREDKKQLVNLISKILTSDDVNPEVYNIAILGAGKYRSDKFFGLLKNIALNQKEKNIRRREFALHSLAHYVRSNPEEVNKALNEVIEENSIYSPLARILSDKINGKYYSQTDRELHYLGLTPKQIEDYHNKKKSLIKTNLPLNIKIQNAIDKSLLPFRRILKKLNKIKYKALIQMDTFTFNDKRLLGQRHIQLHVGIHNSGGFYDTFDGICDKYRVMMNIDRINSCQQENMLGHELGHALNKLFTNEELEIQEKLFKKAIKGNKVLDNYAKTNDLEYFAQGCEAYISPYKPLVTFLSIDRTNGTIYGLMEKDPELYKFIKKCIEKYRY